MNQARPDAPTLLRDDHDLENFTSGLTSLDDWLRRRARGNQMSGASRTYVVTVADTPQVIAYYALAAGAVVAASEVPGRFRRNMPDVIPVSVLARLAIDRAWQGRGLGRALVRDAALRVEQAASVIGIRGLLVDAISEDAKAFYEALGFTALREPPLTLVATLADLRRALDG